MPTFADILSSILHPPGPNDLLRDPMGQGQTLQGMGSPSYAEALAQTKARMQSAAPSPNVPGPLAAFAVKPRIRAKIGAQAFKPAAVVKPRIRLKVLPNV